MKILTICQPYPTLICLPDDDPRAKRVENRGYPTHYRGPLIIHAGKSLEWLELDGDGLADERYELPVSSMAFGAIVATATLADCVMRSSYCAFTGKPASVGLNVRDQARWPWLADHVHATGPYCWILTDVRPLAEPIPWRGAQGMRDAPDHLVERFKQEWIYS